ncbi:UDP-N-acetylmuramoyl-tripeptide--D-alanyl-D-alanine ligase [Neisseriaceae bacterium ESL0693]|nr:UDP-N-acetylmuramoyl-tripeptide--D-alanyl-D-alanine ligase [Neisseriaceae bacterium ESL0693]
MTVLDLAFIRRVLTPGITGKNAPAQRVLTDSRQVQAGDVFVALQGERMDGHDFIDEVMAKGALACVVSRPDLAGNAACILVDDTLKALGTLAKAWRLAVNPALRVFGITGSAGKTTVKEMLTTILTAAVGEKAVLATAGNFNNHIGLPLTLLRLRPEHRYAVIEMGMNHFGELAYLTDLAQPDFALVNNTLRAHVGCGFEGVKDIARAKSEIYQGLGKEGRALIPCEDQQVAVLRAAVHPHLSLDFGIDQGEIHARKIQLQPLSSEFELVSPQGNLHIDLPVPGRHMVHNAIAAAALALSAGIPLAAVSALNHFNNVHGRLQQKRSSRGALLIDDTYNANPDAFKAAIDVLANLPSPRVLVMGAIGELGEESPQLHAEVGAYARSRGIETALFIGVDTDQAACAYGQPEAYYTDKAQLILDLKTYDDAGVTILVKGSRFMHMETIVAALM